MGLRLPEAVHGLRLRFRLVRGSTPLQARSASETVVPPSAAPSRPVNFGSGRSGPDRCYTSLWSPVARVRGRIAFGAPCPQRSMAREASTLSLVACHAGPPRHGIDPVGETSIVPDTPLGAAPRPPHDPIAPTGDIHGRSPTEIRRSRQAEEANRPGGTGPARQAGPVGPPSPSPPRRPRSTSSTPTRPGSTSIPTCTWSASRPTATPTRSASSAPTPPTSRRSSPG